MSQQNLDLIRGLYEAFGRGDIPDVLGRLSADMEWSEAENFPYADRSPYRGHDAILGGLFSRLGSEWDGFSAVPEEFLDAGDTIVVLGRYGGTCKGTGNSLDAQMAHVWRIKDGKVTHFQQYTDTLQAARVMAAA